MTFSLIDFLNNTNLCILLFFILIGILGCIVFFIASRSHSERITFKNRLKDTRTKNMSILIDLEEGIVEKYYPYSQNQKVESIQLEEFKLRFDKTNLDKLRIWMGHIERNADSKVKKSTIELSMYDDTNEKQNYLVRLDRYIQEDRKYYLFFSNINESIASEIKEDNTRLSFNEFVNIINKDKRNGENNSYKFVAMIRYKEYRFVSKEQSAEVVRQIKENIIQRINEVKKENDILVSYSNGTFLLYSNDFSNIRKYRIYLRYVMYYGSGLQDIIKEKYSFSISLVAGYCLLPFDKDFSRSDFLELETAANYLLKKNSVGDRIQLVDDNMKKIHKAENNKQLISEAIASDGLFEISFVPIIDSKTKEVCSYSICVNLPNSISMSLQELLQVARERSHTKQFYDNLFRKCLLKKEYQDNHLILSCNANDLRDVLMVYYGKKENKKLNISFAIDFEKMSISEDDVESFNSLLEEYKEENQADFGINIYSHNPNYQIKRLFKESSFITVSNEISLHSLDSYDLSSSLCIIQQFALAENKTIIALEVSNLSTYETMFKLGYRYYSGNLFKGKIENNVIVNKSLLNNLQEIENRKY